MQLTKIQGVFMKRKNIQKILFGFLIFLSPLISQAELFPSFLDSGEASDLESGNYYLSKLQVDEAWKITRGSKNIKVGIVNTGANYRLDVLASNVDINLGEAGSGKENNGIDDDGNGYVDDVVGINTSNGTNDPDDFHGIGTHIAGLIGGLIKLTPFPVAGVLQNTSLVVASALDSRGAGTYESVVKAIHYVISRGARVVDLGIGSDQRSKAICSAIEQAKEKNVLFITAAGNEGKNLDETRDMYPALCGSENILVVAATDSQDQLASFSNYGKNTVHVAAPGVNIVGYDRRGDLLLRSGTSFAVALAAGVAALALSVNPDLTYEKLKTVLMFGVDRSPELSEKVWSSGRINAYQAVRLAQSMPRQP